MILVGSAAHAQTAMKIGYADVDYILSQMPEAKQVDSEYQAYEAQLQNQLQAKGQEFQRSIAASMAHVPVVVDNLKQLRASEVRDANPALEDWRKTKAQNATK